MQRNGRRVLLYHPAYVEGYRVALIQARADLHDVHLQHVGELADLKAEISELRAVLHTVVTCLREQADQDVATLRHELELALARLTRRDPDQRLH